MRIFPKLFISIFCFVTLTVLALSSVLAHYQISYAKEALINENKVAVDYLTKQIEVGYYQSEWPHENLKKLTMTKDFIFWWVVKNDGTIYRSDNVSFMGTMALDYFPKINEDMTRDGSVYVSDGNNYAIYFKNMKMGDNDWTFWLGFSLEEVSNITNNILIAVSLVLAIALMVLAIFIFLIVKNFADPIKKMLEGTEEISKGNLNYMLKVTSSDEFGKLAKQFNDMTIALKNQRKKLEQYSKDLEKKVKERTNEIEKSKKELESKNKELERFNKMAIGRELKMVELKKKISDLENNSAKK